MTAISRPKAEDFVSLGDERAAKCQFPPGCLVLVKSSSGGAGGMQEGMKRGTVVDAGIDLGSASREDIYQVQVQASEDMVFVRGEDLVFRPQTNVWLTVPSSETKEKVQGVVIGAHFVPAEELAAAAGELGNISLPSLFCSVQTSNKIYHGIQPQNLTLRSAEDGAAPDHPQSVVPPRVEEAAQAPPIRPLQPSARRVSETSSITSSSVTPPFKNDNAKAKIIPDQPFTRPAVDSTMEPPASRDYNASSSPEATARVSHGSPVLSQTSSSSSTTTSQKKIYSIYTGGMVDLVENSQRNPFRFIRVNNQHSFVDALEKVRADRRNKGYDMGPEGGVGKIIFDRCLPFHIRGACNAECRRGSDHCPLDPATARELEEALMPAMSLDGPIFCRPIPNDELGAMSRNPSSRRAYPEPPLNYGPPPPKRPRKLEYFCQTASFDDSGCASIPMKLPTNFGSDFLLENLMGDDGSIAQRLCNEHECSLRFSRYNGNVNGNGGNTQNLIVDLKGPNISKLFQCRLAIEDLLWRATPPPLRGALLFNLGTLNTYHHKAEGFIHTRNPFAEGGGNNTEQEKYYLTLVKAGNFPKPQHRVVSYEQADRWIPALEKQYPDVHLPVIRGDKYRFTELFPHIVLAGPELHTVCECRDIIHDWIKHEA